MADMPAEGGERYFGQKLAQSQQWGGKDRNGESRRHRGPALQYLGDKTFVSSGGYAVDAAVTEKDLENVIEIVFLSDEYFELLDKHPEAKKYLKIGNYSVLKLGDAVYKIGPEKKKEEKTEEKKEEKKEEDK